MTEGEVQAARGKDYWLKRYERHHDRVPGYGNKRHQINEYKEKISFVLEYADNVKTLDFGCGIGWYAPYFDDYLGYDFVPKALELAKERNPTKKFTLTEKEAIEFKADQVLYATVLQHIPEEKINIIEAKTIIIYENMSENEDKHYIWFRSPDFYKGFFNNLGYTLEKEKYHTVHNELHGLMRFEK